MMNTCKWEIHRKIQMFVLEMLPSLQILVTKKGHILPKFKKFLSYFSLVPVSAVQWRSWWTAEHVASLMFLSTLCGWSHGGLFDYSGIIFWLQFNMAFLRESQWNFLFLPCVNLNGLITWAKAGIFSVDPSHCHCHQTNFLLYFTMLLK